MADDDVFYFLFQKQNYHQATYPFRVPPTGEEGNIRWCFYHAPDGDIIYMLLSLWFT
jgi:hypothetical protein